MRYLGLDFALRAGAMAEIRIDSRRMVSDFRIMVAWSKGPATKASLDRATLFWEALFTKKSLSFSDGLVSVDWSLFEVFAGNRKAAQIKSYFVGYIAALFRLSFSTESRPVSPSELRGRLGLKSNCEKEKVWASFEKCHLNASLLTKWRRLNEHEKDAIVLAYCSYLYHREKNEN